MKANENEIVSKSEKTKTQNFQMQQSNNLKNFSGLLTSAGVFLLASSYQDLSEFDSIEEVEEKWDSARFSAQVG